MGDSDQGSSSSHAAASPLDTPGVVSDGIALSAMLAITTIVLGLLAMVVVPIRNDRQAAPLRALQREVASPARGEITALHLALASGEVLLRDYRETLADAPDAILLASYRAQVANAEGHAVRLDSLASRWGDTTVAGWVDSVRVTTARWRRTGEALLVLPGRVSARAVQVSDSAHADNYPATLVAAARLDEAVAAGVRDLQSRLDAAERTARGWTAALAVLALAGTGAALWLGLTVRRGAGLAEQRRLALAEVLESKARFTRGVSHDLKNPLGVIDGHAAILLEGIHGPLAPAQRESLGHIRRSVQGLVSLVDDLLALARAESGEIGVRPVAVDLYSLVREVTEENRAALLSAGLSLDTTIPDGGRPLRTDPARVRQVLGNLFSNARKYTPEGGHVSVIVSDTQASAHIAIKDTGPGIPPDRREFVFEEFSRLPGTTAAGAGLGLAIARRIARLLGGDLWVETAPPGGGACFVLGLPLSDHDGREKSAGTT